MQRDEERWEQNKNNAYFPNTATSLHEKANRPTELTQFDPLNNAVKMSYDVPRRGYYMLLVIWH